MARDHADSVYLSTWTERHWIGSIFAPGAQILQARTRGGMIASGLGATRQEALARCLGETVEAPAGLRGPGRGDGSQHDGCAAGQDAATTRLRALCEAIERVEISHWWAGRRSARRVPPAWLAEHGFAQWLTQMRKGAHARRETDLWQLEGGDREMTVMVCQTCSPMGQDPILGFGGAPCPFDAAQHALREALLMEVNLLAIFAARGGYNTANTAPIEAKIAAYKARCPALLGDELAQMPAQRRDFVPPFTDRQAAFDHLYLEEGWMVWTCRLPDPIFRERAGMTPFMATPTGETSA